MDHSEALAAVAERLQGPTDAGLAAALGIHLQGCSACAAEAAEMEAIWHALGQLPRPVVSEAMTAAILPSLRQATRRRAAAPRIRKVGVNLAWGVGLVALGAAAAAVIVPRATLSPSSTGPTSTGPTATGSAATGPASGPGSQPAAVPRAAETAPTEAMAALFRHSAADGSRARAVAMASASIDPDGAEPPAAIVAALVRTLRSDRNPGVRLRAAEALARLRPTEPIRAAFIKALEKDGNPAVRITAIEALSRAARAQDDASLEALRERAQDPAETPQLRTRVARALETIAL